MGMAADAGAAGEGFVRYYDVAFWEKATLVTEVQRFRKRLRMLFAQGMVLDTVTGAGTHTQAVVRNMAQNKLLWYGKSTASMPKLVTSKIALQVLRAWQEWRVLVEERLDIEFPEFEALQSFSIFNLGDEAIKAETLREAVSKFSQTFRRVLLEGVAEGESMADDAFLNEWAELRAQSDVEQHTNPKLTIGEAWKAGLARVTSRLRPMKFGRIGLSLYLTITGSSAGVERLFSYESRHVSDQAQGHISEESRNVMFALSLGGPRTPDEMVRRADKGSAPLYSRFIRRAQRVWVATQGTYQGAGHYRRRMRTATEEFRKPAETSLQGVQCRWRESMAALAVDADAEKAAKEKVRAVRALGGPLDIDDKGEERMQANPKAKAQVVKWANKWKDRLLELGERDQLTRREKTLVAQVKAAETPKEKKRREAKAKAKQQPPVDPAAKEKQVLSSGVMDLSKAKLFIHSTCAGVPRTGRLVNDVKKADIIVVPDLASCSPHIQAVSAFRGLRLCTPEWVRNQAEGPSVKYRAVTDKKLGLFLSPGFRVKYPLAAAEIEEHSTGLCRGVTPGLLKSWKTGWRLWETFDAWAAFRKARTTQAAALFTTPELVEKRGRGDDTHNCYVFQAFLLFVAVTEKVSRGQIVARAPRRG